MRGQDEIKKALKLCPGDSLECEQDLCPYWEIRLCVPELHMDVLEMMKEQEAVEPIAKEDDTYECICGAIVGWDELDASGIVRTRFNYCPFCGMAVKW